MKKIKKITFISTKIRGGGAERVVAVLSSALAELGYCVDLILYERYDDEYPISSKVNIHMLPARKERNKVCYLINKFLKLRSIISKLQPDVLIPFLPYQVEHTYFASRGLSIPMVVTVRNNPEYDTPNEKMRKRRDRIAERVEGIFLQTDNQKEYFSDCIKKKCFVVPNPVDDSILNSTYSPRKVIKKLVSVGRLSLQKNQKMLIKTIYELRKQNYDVYLDIYGSGELESQLKAQIEELNLEGIVNLCGRSNEIANTLKNYDMFVMTSDYEGMPNALMEAMGVGLPCIATNCPTGPDTLIGNNERGILVPVQDELALEEAIKFAICNTEYMVDIAIRAQQFINQHYAPKVIGGKLIDELERIL